MKIRTLLAAGLVLISGAISLAQADDGLDNPSRNPFYDGVKGKRVVFIPLAMGFDLTEGWAAIMRKQAKDLGYTLEIRDPNWSTDAGTRALTALIAEKPDLIIAHNPDVQSYARLLKRAQDAGRTETMKIVAGVLKRDYFHGGTIRLRGKPVRYRTPRPAVRDGIVYVTEDRKIEGFFETMTIAGNIQLGKLATGVNPMSVVLRSQARRLAKDWTARLGVKAIDSDARIIELSGGNQQKVVVAKALVQEPKLIIFDEPTRGVDVATIVEIHHLINQLADSGMAVVVVSSYLPEILALSDRILVARQGRVVEEMSIAEATESKIMYAAVH